MRGWLVDMEEEISACAGRATLVYKLTGASTAAQRAGDIPPIGCRITFNPGLTGWRRPDKCYWTAYWDRISFTYSPRAFNVIERGRLH